MKRTFLAFSSAWLLSLSATTLTAQGAREGITVQGRWVIEVTNPDGTVVDRREFENALLAGGGALLPGLLTQKFVMGPMDIYVGDAAGLPLGVLSGTVGVNPASPFDNGRIPATSSYDTVQGAPFPTLGVFKGTATALRTGTVKEVYTAIWACQGEVTPQQCGRTNPAAVSAAFSGTVIKDPNKVAAPLTLQKEQGLHVTVTFTFTSPAGG